MKMKSQKGISLVTVSVAILILLIITSVLVYNAKTETHIKKLENLNNDIETLNDKVSNYYLQYGDVPTKMEYKNDSFVSALKNSGQNNPNDSNIYYVLDLEALENVTLSYGKDYNSLINGEIGSNLYDIYVINKVSHTIYYPKGITVENITYYTVQTNYSEVELKVIPISTAEQLSKIGSGETITIDEVDYTFSLDGTYMLKNDIDLSSICYKVDGTTENDKSWTPIGSFTGAFYGNGHEISGLYINTANDYYGLFGYNYSGTIQNFTIKNGYVVASGIYEGGMACGYNRGTISEITVDGVIGDYSGDVGGIVGANRGNIMYCINNATVKGNVNTGGICGINDRGTVKYCANNGNISAKSENAGGIIGYANEGTIKCCVNNGNISGINTGGVVGWYDSICYIVNCYNTGKVESGGVGGGIVGCVGDSSMVRIQNCYNVGDLSKSARGGIVGEIPNDPITVENNYWLNLCGATYGLAGDMSNIGAEPKDSIEMNLQEFIDLLNTGNDEIIWVKDTQNINQGYPILAWQNEK